MYRHVYITYTYMYRHVYIYIYIYIYIYAHKHSQKKDFLPMMYCLALHIWSWRKSNFFY